MKGSVLIKNDRDTEILFRVFLGTTIAFNVVGTTIALSPLHSLIEHYIGINTSKIAFYGCCIVSILCSALLAISVIVQLFKLPKQEDLPSDGDGTWVGTVKDLIDAWSAIKSFWTAKEIKHNVEKDILDDSRKPKQAECTEGSSNDDKQMKKGK
mgnify:CR=1 FL=1